MPRISEFYGITILMFFGDHSPPHFHVRYAGHTARVALGGTILEGLYLEGQQDWSGSGLSFTQTS